MKRNALYRFKKKLRKSMRDINDNVKNDDKFLGRFYIRMTDFNAKKFDDGSGWDVFVTLTFYDRATNEQKNTVISTYCGDGCYAEDNATPARFFGYHLWSPFNLFVCDIAMRDGIMKKDYIPVDYRNR